MKYWETIADTLARSGRSYGYTSYFTGTGVRMFCVDAHRGGERRFVVHADDLLAAFVEFDAQCRAQGATGAML